MVPLEFPGLKMTPFADWKNLIPAVIASEVLIARKTEELIRCFARSDFFAIWIWFRFIRLNDKLLFRIFVQSSALIVQKWPSCAEKSCKRFFEQINLEIEFCSKREMRKNNFFEKRIFYQPSRAHCAEKCRSALTYR